MIVYWKKKETIKDSNLPEGRTPESEQLVTEVEGGGTGNKHL